LDKQASVSLWKIMVSQKYQSAVRYNGTVEPQLLESKEVGIIGGDD